VDDVTINATADLALSVHGPVGVLDLVVPSGAAAVDVAEVYARQAGLATVPVLCSRVGAVLAPDVPLSRLGVRTGDLLVATTAVVPAAGNRAVEAAPSGRATGAGASVVCVLAAACAATAGWAAATSGTDRLRLATVVVLVAAAVLGALPLGRYAEQRATAAPAFAASAAFALSWDPHVVRLPMIVGLCALVAALTAATARALGREADEALQVWIVAGSLLFGLTWMCTLAGAPPRLTWSLLLMLAVLAARVVPGLVVDVPDQYLIDLERLAVTAWSARERAGGKRGRAVVPRTAVAAVAGHGTRMLTAAAAALAVVALVSAPLVLSTATLRVDRIGARCLVGFAGAALLLAARSYRHRGAGALLRTAGLGCWVALLVVVLPLLGESAVRGLTIGAVVLGVSLVLAGVAAGRGWRSAWWSRRAEVAEGLCGAVVVAAVVVSSGWFRQLWELTSLWELGQ
jgi:ESX secretion system protein EccD